MYDVSDTKMAWNRGIPMRPSILLAAAAALLLSLVACAGIETGPPRPSNHAYSAGSIRCTQTGVLPGDDPYATPCPDDMAR